MPFPLRRPGSHVPYRSLIELPQVADLRTNAGHVLLGQSFDLSAGKVVTASKAEEITRIVYGEAEIARAPYEGQALPMRFIVEAVPALSARWRCQKANPLVVADGLDVDTGMTGQISDREGSVSRICV